MLKPGFVFALAIAAALSSGAQAALDKVASESEVLLFQGEIAAFGDRLLSAGDGADGAHLLYVGNVLYRMDLSRAIDLHERALKIKPGDTDVLLELGYDYTAAGRCADAVKVWDALQVGDAQIDGKASAIASYCHVVLGNYDRAVAHWTRSDYHSHHVGIEKTIHGVFGRPDPLITHAVGFRIYSAKGWGAAGEWVRNAIFWNYDWWNQASHQKVLKGIRAALESSKDDAALRELDCVVAMADLPAPKALEAAKECGLVGAGQPVPQNSGIAYVVAVRIGNSELVALSDLWGDELLRRAKVGDVEALNLLAALRATSGDSKSLAEVDELGWKQYKLPTFALSRLYGLGIAESAELSEVMSKQLVTAAETFPLDARLQMMSLVRLHPSGVAYRDAVARLIVAEFHSLSHSSALSAQPNARGLDGFFSRLAAAQRALAEGKFPSLNEAAGE